MFGDMFFAGQPMSFPRLAEDTLFGRMAGDFFEDEVMHGVMEPWRRPGRDLVFGPRAWVKPQPRWCPYTCVVTRPQRPTRQHFVILPRFASDAKTSGDHLSDKGTPDSSKTKDKEQNSLPSRKCTASTSSVSSKGFTSGAGNTCSSTDNGKARGKSPWQFSVDMKGCDEVRAMTEEGMLMVEGRGSCDTSQQMVRYVTSLPSHVSHDSLTASLNNGHLTVTQKAKAQLEGQDRTLPIEVHQQKVLEPEDKQQQQEQHMTPKTVEQQQQLETMKLKEKPKSSATSEDEQSRKATSA